MRLCRIILLAACLLAAVPFLNAQQRDANKPVSGRVQRYCYNEKFARSNDAVFLLAANQTEKTFSLYQYKDKAWSVLDAELVINGTADICTMFADLDCSPDGSVYATVGDNSSGNYLCTFYKYDGTALVKAWNPLPGVSFDDKECQWDLTFDANGSPVIACIPTGDTNAVKLFCMDEETKDWGPAIDLGEAAGSYLATGRADNGHVYIAYSVEDASGINNGDSGRAIILADFFRQIRRCCPYFIICVHGFGGCTVLSGSNQYEQTCGYGK